MNGWLTQLLGEQAATWTLYLLGGIVVLVLVWVIWFWTRRVAGGVFVEGGRNRKHRLAVVDATAIDSNRRIVLVRRDDVEHLVMIGGQNDVVIESGIASVPAEAAQRGQPRDRRPREVPPPQTGRPLRREPQPVAARPSPREEAPRPAAPVAAPGPAQPAREATSPEPPSAAPVVAAAVAATPAYLRREPAPVAEPSAEPAGPEKAEVPDPARRFAESAAETGRFESFADRDEPLTRVPEPPQPPAEPETPSVAGEDRPQFAVDEPREQQPDLPGTAAAEQPDAPEKEEAFSALFARGQGNGSTFAERFMFHASKPAEETFVYPKPETVTPEPHSEEALETTNREAAVEEPSAIRMPVVEEAAVEEEGQVEPVVEFAPEPETEPAPAPEVQPEAGPGSVETEQADEPAAEKAPDNDDDSDQPGESLEDEMHRLLAQLTSGKR
jgi:flagellar protein FliO/FliZ